MDNNTAAIVRLEMDFGYWLHSRGSVKVARSGLTNAPRSERLEFFAATLASDYLDKEDAALEYSMGRDDDEDDMLYSAMLVASEEFTMTRDILCEWLAETDGPLTESEWREMKENMDY